nr:flavin reductase family protein [Natrinema saccharevitans]
MRAAIGSADADPTGETAMTDDGTAGGDDSAALEIDATDHDGSLYRILSSAVVPRPIAWVSTTDGDGVDNLAPYSFFTVASVDPPVLLFAPVDGADGFKDTPRNARDTGEFVVNLVTEDLAEAMNETSATLPAAESEFDHAGLERAASSAVDVPRVAGAKVAFECTSTTSSTSAARRSYWAKSNTFT